MFDSIVITPLNIIFQEIVSSTSPIALDTETDGLDYTKNKAFGISLAFADRSYFLRNSIYGTEQIADFLSKVLKLDRTFLLHNSKFDAHMIKNTYNQLLPFNKVHDTFTISYLYDNETSHELKALACTHLQYDANKYELGVKDFLIKNKIANYAFVPHHLMDVYARKDSEYTLKLFSILYPRLSYNEKQWYNIEQEITRIVFEMENRGILIDVKYTSDLKKTVEELLLQLQKQIYEIAEYRIDILSTEQVGDILYKKFKLPIYHRTNSTEAHPDGQPVVDEMALKQLNHPLAKLILRYRKAHKLLSYCDNFLNVDSNNRLHPTWNPLGTITGRMSSRDPNFQNVTKDQVLHRCIISDKSLTEMDYSQLEFRIGAHVAQESNVIRQYQQNPDTDFHKTVAYLMYNVPIDQVTDKQRYSGKQLNFGIMYGEGIDKLASNLGVSKEEAYYKKEMYFNKFPALRETIAKYKREKAEKGCVVNLFGRTIHVSKALDYAVWNYLIQGGASDLTKVTLVNLVKYFGNTLNIINTVHDSIYVENLESKYLPDFKRIAEDFNFSVPIRALFKRSNFDLGSMKEITV